MLLNLLATVFLLSVSQVAAGPTQPGGAVAGVVIDAATGRVMAGVTVQLVGPWLPSDALAQNGAPHQVVTGDDGRFAFSGLPPGAYKCGAIAQGFAGGLHGQLGPDAPTREVNVSDHSVAISLRLWALPSVSGRVYRGTEGLHGVNVMALKRTARAGQWSWTAERMAMTDVRGDFRLTGLPVGDYVFAAITTTLASPARAGVATTQHIEPRTQVTEIDLPAGRLRNGPLGGTSLPVVRRQDGGYDAFVTSFYPAADAIGEATLLHLDYGDQRTGIEIERIAARAHELGGRVTGEALNGSAMTARLVRPSGIVAPRSIQEIQTVEVDPDGRFGFIAVPTGPFSIVVTGRRPGDSIDTLYGEKPLPERLTDDPSTVNIQPMPTVAGRAITTSGSSMTAPEQRSILVTARAIASGGVSEVLAARVDDSGHFTLALPPGRAIVSANAQRPWVVTGVTVDSADGSQLWPLTFGARPGLTLSVSNMVAGLAGRVEHGLAELPPCVVYFAPWNAVSHPGWTNRFVEVAVDAGGRFSAPPMPPGDDVVIAVEGGLGKEWQQPDILDVLQRQGRRISITAEPTAEISVRLQKVQR